MADRHFHWTGETNNTWQGANWRDENGDLIDHGGHGPGWATGDPMEPDNTDHVYFLGARLTGVKLAVGVVDKSRWPGNCTMDAAYAAAFEIGRAHV